MKKTSMKYAALLMVMIATVQGSAVAQQLSASQTRFFETKIRPALVKYCYSCHSVEEGESRGGLVLDFRDGLLQGGDSGPALVPGKPETSLFWEAINWEGYEMPPSQKMPESVIADFRKWIEMGAPDPRQRKSLTHHSKITAEEIDKGRQHWAFQVPTSKPAASIDSLVSTGLQKAGLTPTAEADGYTLLRRINFDLIGLPPTPDEIQSFQIAYRRNPDSAVRAKIDELLARPQYGERWGRHWLDVARYAESSGSRNVRYPHAWRYRNYVIDSFNDDTPYDRFIAEQLAGDLLPVKSDEQFQENLIATGFLAIGLKHLDEKNPRQFQSDVVDEQIDTTTQAFLGLTVACARCHDHKYDPIPTADYYALAGIFNSTETLYGTIRVTPKSLRPSDLLLLPIPDKTSTASNRRSSYAALQRRVEQMDQELRGLRGQQRRRQSSVRNQVAARLAAMNPDGTQKPFAMGVQEADQISNAHILVSGEVEKPAQEVARGFVQVLGDLNFTVNDNTSSGRLELVEAITSKDNPLTARVMMNRVWMHLLGKPLVETPSNFGLSGVQPRNQELLDHLAIRFMDEDWSIKSMIREIVLSDTYRRSSQYNAANHEVDPANKLLWRANARPLDAEALRDGMLALSGQLNFDRPDGSLMESGGAIVRSNNQSMDTPYRSVYLPIVRDEIPAALDLFDFADPNTTSSGRSESIVPTQALYLMNDEFVMAQAKAFAGKLQKQSGQLDEQIKLAFLQTYGRPATNEELAASTQFFRDFQPTRSSAGPAIRSGEFRPRTGGQRASRPGGRRGQGRRGPGRRNQAASPDKLTESNEALAVFCQTLMATARFRLLR